MKCKDVMTPSPKYCTATANAREVAQIMEEENVGLIPIINANTQKLIGVVTDRDFCLGVVAKGKYANEVPVTECMSKNPITCHPEEDLQRAEQLMKEHQIRRIPVVDEQDRLVGIIAQADIALKAKEPQEVGSVVQEVSKPEKKRPAKAA